MSFFFGIAESPDRETEGHRKQCHREHTPRYPGNSTFLVGLVDSFFLSKRFWFCGRLWRGSLSGRLQIVRYRLLLVEPDVTGVRANESLIKDAAWKLIEVFFFECSQQACPYLGGNGNVVEAYALFLTFGAELLPKGRQRDTRKVRLLCAD